jgi:crotonobetainyl-CoA:carnitine CoA-transferase CaiB-like acyl-CoA transferase
VHGRGFADLMTRLGRPDLIVDPRFRDDAGRSAHHAEFVQELVEAVASRTLDEWCDALHGCEIAWAPVQSERELHVDAQVVANGFIQDAGKPSSPALTLPASPVMFDEVPVSMRMAPEPGGDTESILQELGRSWQEIAALKDSGAVM